jgi:O-antigen ligase
VTQVPAQRVAGTKLILFALIATFLLVAPLSVSGVRSRGGDDMVKWTRVLVLILICISGLRWFRVPRTTECSFRLLVFAGFFTGAAVWSTSPLWGLAFKGMFLASVVAGIALASSLRTEADFRAFARLTTFTAAIAVLGVGYMASTQDSDLMHKGRLWIGQINPNLLGQTASIFALLAIFHQFVEPQKTWRVLSGACAAVMLTFTVLSGSRGSALMLVAGITILLPMFGRQRRQMSAIGLLSLALLSGVVYFWFHEPAPAEFSAAEDDIVLRLVDELTKDTRLKIWTSVANRSMETPIIGTGWLHRGNRASNVQSAYLQVFAETGIVGLVVMAAFLMSALQRIVSSLRLGRQVSGLPSILCCTFSATLFALLFHAIFETALVTGASPNAVLLGFSVAQLDHLMHWGRWQKQSRAAQLALQNLPASHSSSSQFEQMTSD